MDMTPTLRAAEASRVVAILIPSAFLEVGSFQSRLTYFLRTTTNVTGPSIPLMLAGDGTRISFRRHENQWGELNGILLAQLLRFVMDQRRRPLSWWAKVTPPEAWAAIEFTMAGTSYADHEKTKCVICDHPNPLDWFAGGAAPEGSERKGYGEGPCCDFAGCRPKLIRNYVFGDDPDEFGWTEAEIASL